MCARIPGYRELVHRRSLWLSAPQARLMLHGDSHAQVDNWTASRDPSIRDPSHHTLGHKHRVLCAVVALDL